MKYIVKNHSDRILLARLCTCNSSRRVLDSSLVLDLLFYTTKNVLVELITFYLGLISTFILQGHLILDK